METLYSSDEIVKGFETNNKVIIEYVYKTFKQMVRNYITKNSGKPADAEEVIHIAILSFYKHVQINQEPLIINNFTNYFMEIIRKTWATLNEDKRRFVLCDNMYFDEQKNTDTVEISDIMLYMTVQKKFETLQYKCRQLLNLYYRDGYRMKEIAELMGYKSQEMAIKQKHRCLNYLKMMLKTTLYDNQ
jgi:RNA polymerase sigma factor (sigma-70 family)